MRPKGEAHVSTPQLPFLFKILSEQFVRKVITQWRVVPDPNLKGGHNYSESFPPQVVDTPNLKGGHN